MLGVGGVRGGKPHQFYPAFGTKFVCVIGGVVGSVGKGRVCAGIGAVLKAQGYRITVIKVDPYLNTDAGLMSPYEHGEVFVLDDGAETDLDMGNYERTLDLHLKSENNITAGKIYRSVIDNERQGKYLGQTVQLVPHVTDEIVDQILRVGQTPTDGSGQPPHICLVEVGGTVGDLGTAPFLEAFRTLKLELGPDQFCLVSCCLLPTLSGVQKTKPTQQSTQKLLSVGLIPDMLVCRTEKEIEPETRQKIARMCGVPNQGVISNHDVADLYAIPQMLYKGGVLNVLTSVLRLDFLTKVNFSLTKPHTRFLTLDEWSSIVDKRSRATEDLTIAIVAKYTSRDQTGTGTAYMSTICALEHAANYVGRKLTILWVDSTELEHPPGTMQYEKTISMLECANGIIVPGGFGDRGTQGKIVAASWARKNRTPFLGVCLGMQMAVVAFCQDELGLDGCTSEEFDPAGQATHVLRYMPEMSNNYMGTGLVLGARTIKLKAGSVASRLYGGVTEVVERQRHKYEVNEKYISSMEEAGLRFTGMDQTGQRMEVIELDESLGHPFYLGVQCHPEFKSRPSNPAPPFLGLVLAATGQLEKGLAELEAAGPANHYKPSWFQTF